MAGTAFAAAGLFAALAPAVGQTRTVAGIVTDSATGTPLVGTRVELGGRRAWTDGAGRFRFIGLDTLPYTLQVRHVGFRPRDVTDVRAGAGRLRISMVSLPVSLDPIVVTVARAEENPFDAPASVSVVSGEEVREAVAFTPADHLRAVGGVDMASKGLLQHTFAVRGFLGTASDALLVLTDFRPAAVPSIRFNIPYLMPGTGEDIERIEVQRGPGAALYGPGADRGVLHVITRSPFDSRGASISLTGGSRDLLDLSGRWAAAGSRFGVKLSGSWFRARDWPFADTAAARTPDPIAERATGEVRADWRPDSSTEVVLASGLAWAMRATDLTPPGPYQLRDWRNGYVQARWRRVGTFANLALNATNAGDTYSLRSGIAIRDESRQLVAQAQQRFGWAGRHVVAGADLRWTDPRTFGTIHGRNERDDRVRETGAFASGGVSLGRDVEVVAAVRADHHNRLAGAVLSPRVGVVFHPASTHAVRVTFNRAFVTPSTATLFADLVADSFPGLPYGVRVAGVPPGGYTFRRDCGGPCMRSPFDPAGPDQYLPADATLEWAAVVQIFADSGIDLSRVPAPTASDVATRLGLLDVETNGFVPVGAASVTDIGANDRELTNAVELGYKGVLGGRALVAVDLYHYRVSNVLGTLTPVTPNVFLDRATLTQYLTPFVGAAQAAQLAGFAAQLPLGTISPVEAASPTDVLLVSRQGGSYRFWGADLLIEAQATDRLAVSGSWSWTSRDSVPGIALGVPRQKASAAAEWRDASRGLRVELRGRALRSYPVASGVYRGRVDGYGVLDLTVGWGLGPAMHATLSVSNLLDNRHREFPAAPLLGRLLTVRVNRHL